MNSITMHNRTVAKAVLITLPFCPDRRCPLVKLHREMMSHVAVRCHGTGNKEEQPPDTFPLSDGRSGGEVTKSPRSSPLALTQRLCEWVFDELSPTFRCGTSLSHLFQHVLIFWNCQQLEPSDGLLTGDIRTNRHCKECFHR